MSFVTNVKEIRKDQFEIWFLCDNCAKNTHQKCSAYDRKVRHFCSQKCYSDYRRDKLSKEEQHRFGTGYSQEEQAKRRKARSDLNHYMRDKGLERQPCEMCGAKAEAHHDDYDKPLDVRWLCFNHHRAYHKLIYENPGLMVSKA